MKYQNASAVLASNVELEAKRKGGTLADVEKALGCSAGYISRAKAGKKKLSLDFALELAEWCEMDLYDLIDPEHAIESKIREKKEEIEQLIAELEECRRNKHGENL